MLQLHADNRIKASFERTLPLGIVVYHFLDDLEVFLASNMADMLMVTLLCQDYISLEDDVKNSHTCSCRCPLLLVVAQMCVLMFSKSVRCGCRSNVTQKCVHTHISHT